MFVRLLLLRDIWFVNKLENSLLLLASQVSWANWNDCFDEEFDADDDLGCVPKLYTAVSGRTDIELSFLGAVQQGSLTPQVRDYC